MKKIIILLMTGILLLSTSSVKAEQIKSYTIQDSRLRASKLIVNSYWFLDKSTCSFSISFIGVSTGSGIVTLQKKSGSSWKDIREIEIGFTNSTTMSGTMSNLGLSSGTYRLKYDLTVGSINEIIYSLEKSL